MQPSFFYYPGAYTLFHMICLVYRLVALILHSCNKTLPEWGHVLRVHISIVMSGGPSMKYKHYIVVDRYLWQYKFNHVKKFGRQGVKSSRLYTEKYCRPGL